MIDRRHFLGATSALAFLPHTAWAQGRAASLAAPPGTPTIATVRAGRLQGMEANGIRYFRGVPFAEPPIGTLRYKPPVPVKPWSGVRMAVDNPPAPVQTGGSGGAPSMSEDCLYLSITAPSKPGPHPVYMWMYGGGNTQGYQLSSTMNAGVAFARDDVVFVTINYRLGMFGFMELGSVLGPDYAGSGNNGIRDMQAALRWIRDNIEAFGGDPGKVTVAGQSAGAVNTLSLVFSPLTAGLMRGAIVESAGNDRDGGDLDKLTRSRVQANIERFVAGLNTVGISTEDLKTAPAEKLTAAGHVGERVLHDPWGWDMYKTPFGGPFIDGDVFTLQPKAATAAGMNRDIAMMIGWNRDEDGGQFTNLWPDPAKFSPEMVAAYKAFNALHPEIPENLRAERFMTAGDSSNNWVYFDDRAAAGMHTYAYETTWAPQTGKAPGQTVHGQEMPFVFDNIKALADSGITVDPAVQQPFADKAHALWVSFIRDLKPTAPGVTAWPEWSPATQRRYMTLDPSFEVKEFNPAEMKLWQGVYKMPFSFRHVV